MNEMTKVETIFHGDKISEFKTVELQGFVTCFCCGERRGPFQIKRPPAPQDPVFEYDEQCQLAEDAGFLLGLVSGSDEENNIIMEFMCVLCITKFDLPFENPVFRK